MTRRRFARVQVGALSVLVFLCLWEALVRGLGIAPSTLPGPLELVARAGQMFAHAGLANHILVTVGEIWRGALIGLTAGVLVAVLFSRVRALEVVLMPIIVIMQVTPKIAIAPLLVLWVGLGSMSKVFLVALVTFFPVLVNTVTGLRSIDSNVRDLCSVLALTPGQRFLKVEVPSVVPNIVTGLRLGCLAGVTAAVIGEIIGAKAGLGYLVVQSQEAADVAQGLVSVIALSIVGLVLWTGIGAVSARVTRTFSSEA